MNPALSTASQPAASRPTPPRLIIGIGNPSRGDDALGPLCITRLSELNLSALSLADVDLLTDFHLQVEYALDLAGRDEVIVIDASMNGTAPFEFRALKINNLGNPESSHTSHVLSPEAVLATCLRIGLTPPKRTFVLAIRGEVFELGEGLSPQAESNLTAAMAFLVAHLQAYTATT